MTIPFSSFPRQRKAVFPKKPMPVRHRADLRRANLHGANLRNAKLFGANLAGADFRGATWMDGRTCAAASLAGECR